MPEYLYMLQHPNSSMYGPETVKPTLVPCTSTQATTVAQSDEYYEDEAETTPSTNTLCFVNASVTPDPEAVETRHEYMTRENVYIGLMFGSKALVQLITNPFVGPMTNRCDTCEFVV